MKTYELVVLLHPDLEIDVDAPVAKIEKQIDSVSGKIIKRDNWGKRRLSYRVKKQNFAIYIYFEVNLEADKIRSLESALRITEEVLRFLIVKHEEKKEPEKSEVKSEETKETKDTKEIKEKAPAGAKEGKE
ncbi:MAG TPA: 30S ribosomal protein S6 [Candidatus Dormibacteraeota bacterium]|nr:30S ribosomal protein S6 [Candidatus Dormibacteraeota bacterium]